MQTSACSHVLELIPGRRMLGGQLSAGEMDLYSREFNQKSASHLTGARCTAARLHRRLSMPKQRRLSLLHASPLHRLEELGVFQELAYGRI